ncbi:acyltransferase family protein [Maribacter sp. 2210JD10-5]|uniref:acyltransferase family protein n=1 Tax=Maribacter sp. 2210JD10-5 TaxID=3386272 RepID=UPI0039BD36A6
MIERHATYRPLKRNTAIDILRGFCILAVILLHLNIQVPFKETAIGEWLPKRWYNLFFWSGFYGVIIFFTVSGYLITGSALHKWKYLTKVDTKHFYIMRFARIMPLLLALLVVLAALHLCNVPSFTIPSEKVSLGRAIFAALTFHINWLEIKVGYLPANWDVLWSISIEEVFYLFFPLLCLLARKEWHFAVLITVFLFISPWARTGMIPNNELGDRNHLAFLDAIAIGCLVAMFAYRINFGRIWARIFGLLGSILLVLTLFYRGEVYRAGLVGVGLNITLLALGVGLVLLWMHYRLYCGKHKRKFWSGGIRSLGALSYEMYLTHMFVVIAGVSLFKKMDLSSEWIYVMYLTVIIGSALLAKALHVWFTEPVNRWIRAKYIKKEG